MLSLSLIIGDLNLDHLVKVVVSKILHHNLLLFPFF